MGTGAIGYAQQGWSLSLSPDANTVVVGGNADNNNSGNFNGAAWVFAVMEPNTIDITSEEGSNVQTVCVNTAITNITYTTTGATGATFAGCLPA